MIIDQPVTKRVLNFWVDLYDDLSLRYLRLEVCDIDHLAPKPLPTYGDDLVRYRAFGRISRL